MGSDDFKLGCKGQCSDIDQFSITMAFQPVVDVLEKDVYAYEALVRGLNGESAAEVLSTVTAENLYAFDQSCRMTAIRQAAAFGMDKRLNINFMPNAVYHPKACLQKTIETAMDTDFPSSLITFEFTENEQIIDHDHLISIIETYREYGFKTAIDDFGAGYAGLSLLADFHADIVKIDRKIIDKIDQDRKRQAILHGIMKTAEMLGFDVVCEGIERAEEYQYLKALGVRYMQGYFFAKPSLKGLRTKKEIHWGE